MNCNVFEVYLLSTSSKECPGDFDVLTGTPTTRGGDLYASAAEYQFNNAHENGDDPRCNHLDGF